MRLHRGAVAEARQIPAAGWVLAGAALLVCALPVTTHRTPGAAGYLWCALVLAAGLGLVAGRTAWARLREPSGVAVLVVVAPFAGVLAWGAVTLLWSVTPSGLLALLTLLLAGVAAALPALTISQLPEAAVGPVMRIVTAAAVLGSFANGIVYSLRPGLRLAVPLGSASALHLPLILCLAVLLAAGLRTTGRTRWGWGALAGIAAVMTLAADSRAAVLALVLLVWLAALRAVWARRGVLVSALIAAGTTVLLVAFIRWARPDAGLGDGSRWRNHVNGLHAWTDGGWPIVLGRGSGAVWPWLWVEVGQAARQPEQLTVSSPWGALLWHPHSTVLGVLVEQGPLGLLLLTVALGVVLFCAGRLLLQTDPERWLPAAALLATAPGLLLETYLLRGFPAALVWWTVALCVVRWAAGDLRRSSRPTRGGAPATR